MFNNVSPERAGISSRVVLEILKALDSYGFATHSIIMARGNDIFLEGYYKPFDKDFLHRMYSVSKSFVGVAIGFAIDDGLLTLDDKVVDYFSDYENENFDELQREATIRDLLTMSSALMEPLPWLSMMPEDRATVYFETKGVKIPGTLFRYDSPGSFMLGHILENVTGKDFMSYMREKCLDDIGFSKESYCLKCPGGHSWVDSGIMCTTRDLLAFARFVLNLGEWNGKQYLSRDYMKDATSKLVCNDVDGVALTGYSGYGYGYQIWKAPNDGFAFVGMGDQHVICDPKSDFIFAITSDNQGNTDKTRAIFYHEIYNRIIPSLGEPMVDDPAAKAELDNYLASRELTHFNKTEFGAFAKEIENVTYELCENPMGITKIRFNFDGDKGVFSYTNAQGDKELAFGIGYNEFTLFPEDGYSDIVAGTPCPGNKYRCAVSADWAEEKKLRLKVQVIDKYFGNACFVFSFKDERVSVNMVKHAEAFLEEYNGYAQGKAVR